MGPPKLLFWTPGDICRGFHNEGAFLPAHNGFLRFTSGATPADLLTASVAFCPHTHVMKEVCNTVESKHRSFPQNSLQASGWIDLDLLIQTSALTDGESGEFRDCQRDYHAVYKGWCVPIFTSSQTSGGEMSWFCLMNYTALRLV